MQKDTQADAKHLIEQALSLGAERATAFKTPDVVFDPRTILKCMFGCSSSMGWSLSIIPAQ
jgi:predicted metal-binding protein